MNVTIYGIKTCDTVKKARTWLEGRGVAHRFVDYRSEKLDAGQIPSWEEAVGWQKLLNKASTTFRDLPDFEKQDIDRAKAVALMQEHPTLIKRPVLDVDGKIMVGFKPDLYAEAFPET